VTLLQPLQKPHETTADQTNMNIMTPLARLGAGRF
jgi:hypothetical protein